MKIYPKNEPRKFTVKSITISHVADIDLDPDEMVTFRTPKGSEYDVAAKDWGFYATPSLNHRLTQFNLRPALVRSRDNGRRYVLIVEEGKEEEFNRYITQQKLEILGMLDDEHLDIKD